MAPLIHSRTYSVDFRPNFFAIPKDFDKNKIEWAKEFVLASTKELEFTRNDIRKLIFSDGEHCVVGITCYVSTLSKICNVPIEQTKDSTGTRDVYVFLGLTYEIKNDTEGLIFDIPLNIFLDIYKKNVVPRWEDKVANDPLLLQYDSFPVNLSKGSFNLDTFDVKSADNKKVLESNEETDAQLYKHTLSKIIFGQEISMCTKLSSLNSFAKSPFESATCLDITGSLIDILNNLKHRSEEKNKFQDKQSSSRESSNINNDFNFRGARVKEITTLGQIVRIIVIVGGVTYLIIMPTKSIPVSVLVGAGVIMSASYEVIKRTKTKSDNHFSPSQGGRYQNNTSPVRDLNLNNKPPRFSVKKDASNNREDNENKDDVFKI